MKQSSGEKPPVASSSKSHAFLWVIRKRGRVFARVSSSSRSSSGTRRLIKLPPYGVMRAVSLGIACRHPDFVRLSMQRLASIRVITARCRADCALERRDERAGAIVAHFEGRGSYRLAGSQQTKRVEHA